MFPKSVYKTAFQRVLDLPTNRYFHLSTVTVKSGKELRQIPSIHFLMKTLGIDRAPLLSVCAHLGYSFSPLDDSSDIFVKTQKKLLTVKEMVSNFNSELLGLDNEALYSNEELFYLNKIMLRNRLRNLEHNQTYISELIKRWGSAELLECFYLPSGELNQSLLLEVFFDIQKFSEISELNDGLAYTPDELQEHKHLVDKLENEEIRKICRVLASIAEKHLGEENFDKKSVGMLFSHLISEQKQPERAFKSLEQLLFKRCCRIGLPLKAILVGREDFLDRIKSLAKYCN